MRSYLLVTKTGYDDAATCERIMQAGFDHYLFKPCNAEELENILAAHDT
jgi:ActR/RegA family two-component response regulator